MTPLDDNVNFTYEDLVRDPDLAERAIRRGRRLRAQAVNRMVASAAQRLFGAGDTRSPHSSAPAKVALATPNGVRTAPCG